MADVDESLKNLCLERDAVDAEGDATDEKLFQQLSVLRGDIFRMSDNRDRNNTVIPSKHW